MDFKGSYRFNTNILAVWNNLNKPESIKSCIDGCQEFLEIDNNYYKARIKVNLGPVNAVFSAEIKILNIIEQKSYVIDASGNAGNLGFGKGIVKVDLKQEKDDTILNYSASTKISGKIAQLGSRLIEGSVKKNTTSFFNNFEKLLKSEISISNKQDLKLENVKKDSYFKKKKLFIFLFILIILSYIFYFFNNA